jgi:hypothetical protein
MPLVGKDWTQSGVARLFSAIKVRKMVFIMFVFVLGPFKEYNSTTCFIKINKSFVE